MRLKTAPEDFAVREATGLRIRKEPAPYRVYMLEKTGWNTVDALTRIAKEKRVPYDRFGYGGKKDRHAHTWQYVTVQYPADLSLTAKGYSFKMLGYSAEPMEPAKIAANHFELVVREMTAAEEARLLAGVPRVREHGLPNYFDDQRFGNYDRERGFIAEKMLQGKWEEGLNMALTAIYPEEHKEAKERKRALREHWGNWETCRELATTAFEQRCFTLLMEKPGAYREALSTAHREMAMLWISTYQSFLWNETLRRWIAEKGWAGTAVPGPAGKYLFPTTSTELENLIIPLPGKGMRFPEPGTGIMMEEVLRERRLRPTSLEGEPLPGVALKASPREALIKPASLWVDGPEPDDRYPNHRKVGLRFSLPRGAYATMLVKALMA